MGVVSEDRRLLKLPVVVLSNRKFDQRRDGHVTLKLHGAVKCDEFLQGSCRTFFLNTLISNSFCVRKEKLDETRHTS